jgi:glycine dehydrogenase subunit 1
VSAKTVVDRLLEQGILAGLPLGEYWSDMQDCLLVAVTEIRTKEEIDRFAAELSRAIK